VEKLWQVSRHVLWYTKRELRIIDFWPLPMCLVSRSADSLPPTLLIGAAKAGSLPMSKWNNPCLHTGTGERFFVKPPVSSYICPNISILSRDLFPLSKNRCCTVCRIFHIACPFQQFFLFFRCCQKSFRVSYLCRSHGTDVYKVNICIFILLTYAYVNTVCNFLMFTPQ